MEKLTFNKLGQWELAKSYLTSNKNKSPRYTLTPEDQHYLVDNSDKDSWTHKELASYEDGIDPEVQRKLIERNDKDSDVHLSLCDSKDIPLELMHKLLDKNEPGSKVYNKVSNMSDLHPELQNKLFDSGHTVNHGYLYNQAGRKNIPLDLQHKILDTLSSDKHGYDFTICHMSHNHSIHPDIQHRILDITSNPKSEPAFLDSLPLDEKWAYKDKLERSQAEISRRDSDKAIAGHTEDPSVQHRLADRNERGSWVHHSLYYNKNLHPSVKPKITRVHY